MRVQVSRSVEAEETVRETFYQEEKKKVLVTN